MKHGAGITPDSPHAAEHGEAPGSMERQQKAAREELISAYDRNIATRLKAELCSVDPANYGYTRDAASAGELSK